MKQRKVKRRIKEGGRRECHRGAVNQRAKWKDEEECSLALENPI